jgi:spermidine synthase
MTKAIPFLAGFTAAVGQIVLMREVIVLFNGNELSLGIVLAAWLMWTAAGSGLTGILTRNRAAPLS